MKVLYAAFKHNPTGIKSSSTASCQFYNAIKNKNHEIKTIGPYDESLYFLERALNKIYRSSNKRNYLKYKWTNTIKACKELNRIDKEWKPDVIFSLTPSPFIFYNGKTPIIFRTDTTFLGMNQQAQRYLKHDPIMLRQMVWQEKRALSKCRRVITHSKWSKHILTKAYGINSKKISLFPNPAAMQNIQKDEMPDARKSKNLKKIITLLTVGRDFHRKGIDIAIKIVNKLNKVGLPSKLQIVGLSGENGRFHKYFGEFDKADEEQFVSYKTFFKDSHLLLHSARFDASPIVTSEASAFGLPTITNDCGGLATSVKHNVSGIVLPKGSKPDNYVDTIQKLLVNPERYYALCQSTRKRYEKSLNWEVAGDRLETILNHAIKN